MIAEINGVNIKIKNCIPPVQGAVGIKMRASFSEEWSPLSVIAVFRAGTVQRDVIVEDGELTIPWEVLQKAGCPLYLNFYGADASGAVVLKTVQVELGTVAPSPDPSGEAPEAPTPARADQIQALAEEALAAAQEVQAQAASGAFDGQDGADGRDGINGTNGTNGVSPRITVSETTGGHTVHITDAAGESSFDVPDGAPGEVSRTELASALATKAESDGSYDSMTVGNAKQLIATVGVTDRTPYTFRTAGGAADIGDRAADKLVGGTIAWNQLIRNGNFADSSYWQGNGATIAVSGGIASFTPTQKWGKLQEDANSGRNVIAGHRYLAIAEVIGDTHTYIEFGTAIAKYLSNESDAWQQIAAIGTASAASYSRFGVGTNAEDNFATISVRNAQIHDLTQMFGAQIADHVYALEDATPGAGVAWFKKLFPKPYYAYNPGELLSVKASAHKMVGFNAWNEEWELGALRTDGGETGSATRIRNKGYIPVVPNMTYYRKTPNNIQPFFYDADKNFIQYGFWGVGMVTTPANAHYLRFQVDPVYGTTYKNDICINLSWDGERDGEYAPYEEHSYPLDDALTLRGVPKLDSSGSLYFDGDTYESDGTVTRFYQQESYQAGDELLDNTLTDGTSTVKKYSFPVYEVAAPYQNPQIADDFGTEEYVVPEQNGVAVPIGHETVYQVNLRAKLEMAPESPDGDGDYIVRQTNGENRYVPLTIPAELPPAPSADGTYRLQITVTNGTSALSWVNA